jgi:glycosyltransferase involved in cell wall biosynthesis
VRIGVVVPVHGWAPYLAETLDAILGEEPGALVVVDDGSPEPLVLHPDHAPHATLVRREARGGVAAARATGEAALDPAIELVASCDADDAWLPGKLAAQVAALEPVPQAGGCFGRARIVGTDGRPTGERWRELRPGLHTGTELVELLYAANPIPTSSVMLRRDALEAAGGFPSPVRLAEDWDLWLRLASSSGGLVCMADTLVRYRRHPGGLTADVAALARCQLELHRAHGDRVSETMRERALAADTAALRSAERRGLRALVPRRDPYRR